MAKERWKCNKKFITFMDLKEANLNILENLFSDNYQILNLNIGTNNSAILMELINTFKEVKS